LINYYRNGRDYINEHPDDEDGLDATKSILSASFGQQREFVMYEPKISKRNLQPFTRRPLRRPVIVIQTGHGQGIEMLPGCQQQLTHMIRQVNKKDLGHRVNITLRCVV
jgi:alkylated DNA repair dioxygenase AlkB